MVDATSWLICFLMKKAVTGIIAGAIIGLIPFSITRSIKVFGFTVPVLTILSIMIGFEINVC